MSAELFLQKTVRAGLVGSANLQTLVPAGNILDRNERPNPRPSIIIGEGQAVDEGGIARTRQRVYLDLHVWIEEPSTETGKRVAGLIRAVIRSRPRASADGFHLADCRVSSTRYLRDPDGETSHSVVTVEALVQEVS